MPPPCSASYLQFHPQLLVCHPFPLVWSMGRGTSFLAQSRGCRLYNPLFVGLTMVYGCLLYMQIWSIRQRWILEVIKLLLFFLSFVVGQSIFFAVFFGPDSCFFSQTGGWRPMLLLLRLPVSHLVWVVCCSDG